MQLTSRVWNTLVPVVGLGLATVACSGSPTLAYPNAHAFSRASESSLVQPQQHASQVLAPVVTPSVSFDQDGASGRIAFSQGKLLASGVRQVHAEVRVTARPDSALVDQPISIVVALDTSGSMAGTKIAEARHAIRSMFANLRPRDEVAVVRFSSDAGLVVPLQPVSSLWRSRADSSIHLLQANGSTNIAAGLSYAMSEISRASYPTRRIILVTDGRDTSGSPRNSASQLARSAMGLDITVSALGIGFDYDDAYLADLSDAGRGTYAYLGDTSALDAFFRQELRDTQSVTLRRMQADLRLPPGTRVVEVLGATRLDTQNGVQLNFGALQAGRERRAIITLESVVGNPGSVLDFGASFSWVSVRGQQSNASFSTLGLMSTSSDQEAFLTRDHDVFASVASVRASQLELDAARHYERGDREQALALNRQSIAVLEEAERKASPERAGRLRAQKKDYAQDSHVYTTPGAAAPAARQIGQREVRNAQSEAMW